jgi:hypothetical protein
MFPDMPVDGDASKDAIHKNGFLEFNGAIYAQATLDDNTGEQDISSIEMTPEYLMHAIEYCIGEDKDMGREMDYKNKVVEIMRLVDACFPYDEKYGIRQEVADPDAMAMLVEMFPTLEEFLLGRDFSDASPSTKRSWKMHFMGKLSDASTLRRLNLVPDGCFYGESKAKLSGKNAASCEWDEDSEDKGYKKPRPFYENMLPSFPSPNAVKRSREWMANYVFSGARIDGHVLIKDKDLYLEGEILDKAYRARQGSATSSYQRLIVQDIPKPNITKCKYVSTLEDNGHVYMARGFGHVRIS